MPVLLTDALIRWARQDDWRHYLLQSVYGASLVFSYAPYGHWYLVFPGLFLTAFTLPYLDSRRAFWHGLAFALGYFGTGMSWVHVSVYQFGETGLILSTLFTLGFVALLALFPATAFWMLNRYFRNSSPASYWLVAWPGCWLLMEWIRSWIFTGLPWLNLGHGQINGPLSTVMPVLGANAASLWVLIIVATLILIYQQGLARIRTLVSLVAMQCLLWAGLASQQWVYPTQESLTVTMIQPNVAQDKKWDFDYRLDSMRYLYQTTKDLSDDLVIWPEAAIPALAEQVPDFLEAVDALAEQHDQTILTGIPIRVDERFYNAVRLYGTSDGEYRKRHLVPFGEYVPFEEQLRGLIKFFDMPMSSFSRGDFDQPRLQVDGHQVAMAICYEIIFQSLVAQQVAGSDYLVTLSNDAWFGETIGPHQHLELARIRALENGIPVIRATNDGVSAFINAEGEVVKSLGKGKQGLLSHEMTLYRGMTPFKLIGPDLSQLIILGPWVLGLLLLVRRHSS